MKRLKNILRYKCIIRIILIIIILSLVIFTKYHKYSSLYNIDDDVFIGNVISYDIQDNKIKILLKGKEKLIVNYNYGNLVFNKLQYGDKLLIKGKLYTPVERSNFNSFDYRKYLYYKKVYYMVDAYSIDKLSNNSNYLYTIKNVLYDRVDNLKSKDYIKTLLFNDNSLEKEVNSSYRFNGIAHLFAVSGFHVNFIVSIIYLYLDKVSYRKKFKYIVVDIILILYLILFYSPSLFRAVILSLLFSIKYLLKIDIDKIDIMICLLFICTIINPFIIYDIGFLYSYVISFFLILFGSNKNKYKSIYISILSFLCALPITVYNFSTVNVFGIIICLIATPIISFIVMPLSFITIIFPIFDDILYYVTLYLSKISIYLSDIKLFSFIFPKPSILFIVIYYIILFIVLKKDKYKYLIFILIFILYMSPYFNIRTEIVMFDVGQGDCFFIRLPFNRGNILIDTGGGNSYSKMNNDIIPYFKSRGIRRINYLVISHGDLDHMGDSITLVNNFKVDKVIFNCGEYNELERELIEVLKNKRIKYYSCIDELNINGKKLYFLNNEIYDNENDNSVVLYTELNRYRFLFMGDAGIEVEKDLMDKYNLENVDILKVGHHGSKTSSSREFIDYVRPRYSIISVGKNNIYGHPNKEVLDVLKNTNIYRTDIDGSIMFKIRNNKLDVDTCSP